MVSDSEPDTVDGCHDDNQCHVQQRSREKEQCQSQPFPHPLPIRVDPKADETTTGAEQQPQSSDRQQSIACGDCRIGNDFIDDGFPTPVRASMVACRNPVVNIR